MVFNLNLQLPTSLFGPSIEDQKICDSKYDNLLGKSNDDTDALDRAFGYLATKREIRSSIKEKESRDVAESSNQCVSSSNENVKVIHDECVMHEVEEGDTLYGLELKYHVSVREIRKQNPHLGEFLNPGALLRIPVSRE